MESHKHSLNRPTVVSLSTSLLFVLLLLGTLPIFAQYKHASPSERLQRLINQHQSLRFQLIQERDPYRPEAHFRKSQEVGSILAFKKDHTFVEKTSQAIQPGHWELDAKEASLTIHYNPSDNQTRGQQSHFQEFQIRSFSHYRLVLAWQGRHGVVERTYVLDR